MLSSAIIIDDIDDTYAYGQYADSKVIMMKRNCYINATKLCKEGGKRFDHWLANQQSKDFIEEVKKASPALSGDAPIITITGGSNGDIRGTYCHRDLIPFIASWVSPKFALAVSRIVNNYINREFSQKNNELTQKNDELSKKIENLEKLILNGQDEIKKQNIDR